ncbi:hypothetical protein [Limnohabitans sp. 2KL-51]|uniref:hypothetical protein n=1 Tax=Limnohabitans sp. 2KL-51 TaxID=1977911 RepID=UPI001304F500|nr:hypothetical protein [Limnohabitans sp. 2KL-51]
MNANMDESLTGSPAAYRELDELLPLTVDSTTLRVVEGLRVMCLRYLEHGVQSVESALLHLNLKALPQPDTCAGPDPWQVWINPTESLVLTTQSAVADSLLNALQPGRDMLACALDQSAGCLVLELTGRHVDGVLTRLMEASANPQIGGQSTRVRLMDISATLIRIDPNRVFLAVDRPQGLYAFQWIAYVLDTVAEPRLSKP